MMKTYARIDNGVVAEIFMTNLDINTLFHPSITWVNITHEDGISVGWHYDGETFSPPTVIEWPTQPETAAS